MKEAAAGELWRALASISEISGPHRELSRALRLPDLDPVAQTELFILQLPPYASRYLSPDAMLGGEDADRVAGLWRVLGLTPPPEPDHLASILGLYAGLCDAEVAARSLAEESPPRRVREVLFWEHIATWLPPYLLQVSNLGDAAQRAWAELVLDAVAAEAAILPVPKARPLTFREAPAPVGPDTPTGDAIEAVLVPARSGLIITKSALARASVEIGAGLRLGERRYTLQALLDQDPGGTLTWLCGESSAWRRTLLRLPVSLTHVIDVWSGRVAATEVRLSELAKAALAAASA
jgi:hypothetical protein